MLECTAIVDRAAAPAEILDRRHCSSDALEPGRHWRGKAPLIGAAGVPFPVLTAVLCAAICRRIPADREIDPIRSAN
jgi:hypothetical protein